MPEFSWNAYSIPLVFGFVQGSLYTGLLCIRAIREQRLSDALLALLLAALSLELLDYMLGFGGIEILWQELDFFPRDLGLLIGPIGLAYLHSQTNRSFRLRWVHLWHALPFLTVTIYHLIVFFLGPAFVRDWQARVHLPLYLDQVETIFEVVSNVSYIIACFRHYRRYRQWLPQHLSDLESAQFTWFRSYLILISLGVMSAWGMALLTELFALSYWQDWWDELLLVGIIYYLSIAGYQQPQQLKGLTFQSAEHGLTVATSNATPEVSQHQQLLARQLTDYLLQSKPYLDPQLSLADLAERLKWSQAQLSSTLNAGLGISFSDAINSYRVEEFKQRAMRGDTTHLSLLGLALECGFNSKATFNRAFKKQVGQAPSDWLSSQHESI